VARLAPEELERRSAGAEARSADHLDEILSALDRLAGVETQRLRAGDAARAPERQRALRIP
jgi:hypothetical protein